MIKIVCFGDSITECPDIYDQDRWTSLLQKLLDKDHPNTFKVINRGKCGHTSADALERINCDLIPELPAIVLIEFGFNDANVRDWLIVPRVSLEEYKRNLSEICRIVRLGQGQAVIIINHTLGESSGMQGNKQTYKENFAPYNKAAFEIAQKENLPTIDLPSIMEKQAIDLATFLDPDGLHLSVLGNHFYAKMIFEGLHDLALGIR